jgi:molybdopterin-guanine dinucleotide biosynthesis protein A
MGGEDKGLLQLQNRPMIQWVLDQLSPQVSNILISANRNEEHYAAFGHPIVPDTASDFRGPLAGVAAVLAQIDTPWLVSVPCDSPLIPLDLVQRFYDRAIDENVRLGVAYDGCRIQPAFILVHRDLCSDLVCYLDDGGRKIDSWLHRHKLQLVDFSDYQEMFLNINTPADLEAAVTLLQKNEPKNGARP